MSAANCSGIAVPVVHFCALLTIVYKLGAREIGQALSILATKFKFHFIPEINRHLLADNYDSQTGCVAVLLLPLQLGGTTSRVAPGGDGGVNPKRHWLSIAPIPTPRCQGKE